MGDREASLFDLRKLYTGFILSNIYLLINFFENTGLQFPQPPADSKKIGT